MNAPAELLQLARSVASRLYEEMEGDCAVLVATPDGFSLAHAGQPGIEPDRLAAVASSIAALGDAASRETAIGDTRCLVVEAHRGRLVMRCLRVQGADIVVVLKTGPNVLLGMAWSRLAGLDDWLQPA